LQLQPDFPPAQFLEIPEEEAKGEPANSRSVANLPNRDPDQMPDHA
jgi:hypothetical protein